MTAMNYSERKQSTFIVMLFPLVFTLIPRPSIPGFHFLTFPIIASILALILLIYLRGLEFEKRFIQTVAFLFLYMFALTLSSLVNSGSYPASSIIEILKPILFLIILSFGYLVGRKKNYDTIKRGLLSAAYIILFFQMMVGIPQMLGIDFFNSIYNAVKSRSIGGILRIAGTLSNPNFFAWIVMQSAVIIFLFEKKKTLKVLGLIVATALVLLSGSRSSLLLFPLIIFAANIFRVRKNISFFFVKLPLYVTGLATAFLVVYWFLKKYGTFFPYLNQLFLIIEGGSLDSINSFNARTLMWDSVLYKMQERPSIITTLFGLGPGSIPVLDSDYLYSYVNYGLMTTIIQILFYVFVFYLFWKLKIRDFGALGQQYIAFSFIIGYQAETLSGWNYPLLIMFYTGIAIALYHKKEEIPINVKKRKRYKITW